MATTILWFILVGAVVGVLARLLVPGRNPIGIVLTILVGVAGAILGGVIANALGAGTVIAFIFAVIIAAIGVALLTGAQGGRGGWWARGRTR
ncbi:MAG: hypothetical protein JWN52_601 [Actinomycetia bacterium]|jgi:uncharacterized membrane protein YeaQ/YmgE (transglycosylase-associated protein family)|nr:hypothetical protein [Actinomycetes bacterium]